MAALWKHVRNGGVLQQYRRIVALKEIFSTKNLIRCFCSTNNMQISDVKIDQENTTENADNAIDYSKTVHPDIIAILEKSRPKKVNGVWHEPRYNARRLANVRNKFISEGYYWPRRPLVDRALDLTPKGHKKMKRREERQATIKEKMEQMPQIIAEYRKKMQILRAKRREEKQEAYLRAKEAKRLGYNPNDPRQMAALNPQTKAKGKKETKKK